MVLQININGLIAKSLEIHKLLVDYEVDVAMLQELRTEGSPRMPSFSGYTISGAPALCGNARRLQP